MLEKVKEGKRQKKTVVKQFQSGRSFCGLKFKEKSCPEKFCGQFLIELTPFYFIQLDLLRLFQGSISSRNVPWQDMTFSADKALFGTDTVTFEHFQCLLQIQGSPIQPVL